MSTWEDDSHDVPDSFHDVADFNQLRELQAMLRHLTVEQLHEKLDSIGGVKDFIWTMRTGEKVPVGSLNTPHLKNCIRMMSKKVTDETRMFEPDKAVSLEILKYELKARNE